MAVVIAAAVGFAIGAFVGMLFLALIIVAKQAEEKWNKIMQETEEESVT